MMSFQFPVQTILSKDFVTQPSEHTVALLAIIAIVVIMRLIRCLRIWIDIRVKRLEESIVSRECHVVFSFLP